MKLIIRLISVVAVIATTTGGMSAANTSAQTAHDREVARQKAIDERDAILAYISPPTNTPAKTTKRAISNASVGLDSFSPEFILPVYQLPVPQDCITNTEITYGVPEFDSNAWETGFWGWDIAVSPWLFDPTKQNQAAMSLRQGFYPKEAVDSDLAYQMPSGKNVNGDRLWYSIKFWFTFGISVSGDKFEVGTTDYMYWYSYTNLQYSSWWTRVGMVVAPHSSVVDLVFHVHKAAQSSPGMGPLGVVAAVQVCPINTDPVTGDFVIWGSTNNTTVVAWNTIAYPPPRWVLSSASEATGPYTNTVAGVQYSGLTAYVSIPATNSYRFFRLRTIN